MWRWPGQPIASGPSSSRPKRTSRSSGSAGEAALPNLFAGLPRTLPDERVDRLPDERVDRLPDERVDRLVEAGRMRLERIVSTRHTTSPGQWCDQDTNEWVVVLRGRAGLRFEDEAGLRVLGPGDYVLITAHRRHRVEWTDPGEPTVWLALHY